MNSVSLLTPSLPIISFNFEQFSHSPPIKVRSKFPKKKIIGLKIILAKRKAKLNFGQRASSKGELIKMIQDNGY